MAKPRKNKQSGMSRPRKSRTSFNIAKTFPIKVDVDNPTCRMLLNRISVLEAANADLLSRPLTKVPDANTSWDKVVAAFGNANSPQHKFMRHMIEIRHAGATSSQTEAACGYTDYPDEKQQARRGQFFSSLWQHGLIIPIENLPSNKGTRCVARCFATAEQISDARTNTYGDTTKAKSKRRTAEAVDHWVNWFLEEYGVMETVKV